MVATRCRWLRAGALLGFAFLTAFATPALAANDEWKPVQHPHLVVSRAPGQIEIDGKLDDAGWVDAARAVNFVEHNPGDQTQPAVKTEAWITYDDDNLYVAWLCYDDPSEVRASFCERDRIFSDDYVILCIDTYGEATLAYEISTNPYGIPGDLLFSSANGEDITYDMVYKSAARLTDFGWVAEMAIPFASLRFPDREQQVWRVDFWRNRPRGSRFQYSWAKYDRDEDCWPCQWGTIEGIAGVKPGAGVELLPAVVSHQTGELGKDGHFNNSNVDGEVSLGVSYDISSELTAEATINPDFSQVESDVAQIDVNSTFALFYPERRPFFQEGSDLFNSYFNAVYTRSINDPMFAGKMTWRKGVNSMALLSARDQHSVLTLPFEEYSRFVENGTSYSTILRARRDLGEQSHLGLVATDRHFEGGGSGSLAGLDGRIRLTQSDALRFQVLSTYTEEVNNLSLADSTFNAQRFDGGKYTAGLDGEKFWGHGLYTNLGRNASDYWLGADYWERSPTFRADNGFEPSNDYRVASSWVGGVVRFDESGKFETLQGDVNASRKWNFDGVKKDEWILGSMQLQLRAAQTAVQWQYLRSNELFGGVYFQDIWQASSALVTQPTDMLKWGGYVNYGHRIARRDLAMGVETGYGLWADFKPIDRVLVSSSFDRIESEALQSGERLFSQSLFWSRVSLQLSRELSTRVVLQYNDSIDRWDVDPLITYRLNPFSIFYIGSTLDYRRFGAGDVGGPGWTLAQRQYFMKIQYLFQL